MYSASSNTFWPTAFLLVLVLVYQTSRPIYRHVYLTSCISESVPTLYLPTRVQYLPAGVVQPESTACSLYHQTNRYIDPYMTRIPNRQFCDNFELKCSLVARVFISHNRGRKALLFHEVAVSRAMFCNYSVLQNDTHFRSLAVPKDNSMGKNRMSLWPLFID